MDPKKPEKGRRLCLAAIFERLFFYEGVCSKPIPSLLHVLDYAIAPIRQSCNSERAGSHINRVKTLERIKFQKDPPTRLCLVHPTTCQSMSLLQAALCRHDAKKGT